jgi:hypothetical protein
MMLQEGVAEKCVPPITDANISGLRGDEGALLSCCGCAVIRLFQA